MGLGFSYFSFSALAFLFVDPKINWLELLIARFAFLPVSPEGVGREPAFVTTGTNIVSKRLSFSELG